MHPSDFLLSGLGLRLKTFLTDSGRAGGRFLHDLQDYVTALAPIAEQNAAAALAGDEVARSNLGYLADLAVLHAGRLAEDFTAAERDRLRSVVLDVVTSFVGLAANAVAPGAGAAIGAIVGAVVGGELPPATVAPDADLAPAERDVLSGALPI